MTSPSPTTTSAPSVNFDAVRPLMMACHDAVHRMREAQQRAFELDKEAKKARAEASDALAVINAHRAQVRLRFPGAPGVVNGVLWAPPDDYANPGSVYRPVDGDILLMTEAAEPPPNAATCMNGLKAALKDRDYAWAWHCNVTMPIQDAMRAAGFDVSHAAANYAASRIMHHLFDEDTAELAYFPSGDVRKMLEHAKVKGEPEPETVTHGQALLAEHRLWSHDASEMRASMVEDIQRFRSEKRPIIWSIETFERVLELLTPLGGPSTPAGRLSRIMLAIREHAADLTEDEMRDFSDTISAELESLGGDPVEEVVHGSDEDLRPLIAYPARRLSLAFTHPSIGDGIFTTEVLKAIGEFAPYMARCESLEGCEGAPEPRYPFTASNGVVVDILPWKTVDDSYGASLIAKPFPFLSAEAQLEKMVDVIRTTAESVKDMFGIRPQLPDGELKQMFDAQFDTVVERPIAFDPQIASVDRDVYVELLHPDQGIQIMKELKDTAESHASLVLYPAIRAAMNELGQLHEGFSDNVNRAWNTLHAAFWSESPAPASEPGLRGVASQEAETVVEPSSNRGVLPDPGEMGFPATYTFEQFVQYGRQHAEELVNGVPWHFAFHGRMVTHERDDCYLVGGTSMAKHFRFTPGRKITVNLDGSMTLHYEEKNATFLDVAEAAQEKQHFAHIEPTIGRRVWYRPDARMGATNFHILGDQPMDAGIVFVWGQRLVNLDVTDHAGVHHAFTSVTLLQPGDKEPENGGFCQWMPFQIGQARK